MKRTDVILYTWIALATAVGVVACNSSISPAPRRSQPDDVSTLSPAEKAKTASNEELLGRIFSKQNYTLLREQNPGLRRQFLGADAIITPLDAPAAAETSAKAAPKVKLEVQVLLDQSFTQRFLNFTVASDGSVTPPVMETVVDKPAAPGSGLLGYASLAGDGATLYVLVVRDPSGQTTVGQGATQAATQTAQLSEHAEVLALIFKKPQPKAGASEAPFKLTYSSMHGSIDSVDTAVKKASDTQKKAAGGAGASTPNPEQGPGAGSTAATVLSPLTPPPLAISGNTTPAAPVAQAAAPVAPAAPVATVPVAAAATAPAAGVGAEAPAPVSVSASAAAAPPKSAATAGPSYLELHAD